MHYAHTSNDEGHRLAAGETLITWNNLATRIRGSGVTIFSPERFSARFKQLRPQTPAEVRADRLLSLFHSRQGSKLDRIYTPDVTPSVRLQRRLIPSPFV